MEKSFIVTNSGLTLDLAQVKCFKLNPFSQIDIKNTLVVEFKRRFEFVLNPATGKHEMLEINDTTEIEFPDYETADLHRHEWAEIWQDYLKS